MNDLWKQLEDWLAANWPEGLASLNPPATDEEISALEQALGARLPQDFIDCLKIHNGQSDSAGGLFDNADFLSTSAILDQWTVWKELLDSGDFEGIESEPEEGVRNDWWNARWIPFTYNGAGDHYCLDLAPDEAGQVGQVITMWHDSSEREILGNSFAAWLKQYVSDVLAGEYVYSDDYGGLVPKEDA
ncbi:SMI1/KNR4 family protein [Roseateles sp. UC29_93]|uniref:SMI1/KNR4 family protein n=1 Tax=Roseateles sp. UC29_93 TaxID=3350177 RepID=UPI0036700B69